MNWELCDDNFDGSIEFRIRFSRLDLITTPLDTFDRALLNEVPTNKASDILVALEVLARRVEQKQEGKS